CCSPIVSGSYTVLSLSLKIRDIPQISIYAITGSQFQPFYPLIGYPKWLIMDIPSQGNTREKSPLIVLTQIRSTIIPGIKRKKIFTIVVVGHPAKIPENDLFCCRTRNTHGLRGCI